MSFKDFKSSPFSTNNKFSSEIDKFKREMDEKHKEWSLKTESIIKNRSFNCEPNKYPSIPAGWWYLPDGKGIFRLS
ncbi:MAG: hypothetical protein ABJG41_14900 [Cyclobacteriaceae bacterium]